RGDESVVKDLSSNIGSSRIGLRGIDHDKLFKKRPHNLNTWRPNSDTPINTRLTWYKTTFKAPLENNPVVVDLTGISKGETWITLDVALHHVTTVARMATTSVSPIGGSLSKQNNISYHVPPSFLKEDENTLVLFEKFGGNPSQVFVVLFKEALVKELMMLKTFLLRYRFLLDLFSVKFIIACVGQKSCLVDVSENTSGKGKSCGNEAKRLAVESLLTM
ncbi:Beta-galactosidase 7, partial [Bienertia sinuspersici]